MLDHVVHRFTDGRNRWNDMTISCHNATHYWLLKSSLNAEPTAAQYGKVCFKFATNLQKMIRKGTRLSKQADLARVAPGTVLIFSANGVNGDHSCVFKNGGIIAGYNQTGWLPGGVASSYSTHPYTSIEWIPGGWRQFVKGDHGHPKCQLFAVPEDRAIAVIQKVLLSPE